MNCSMLRIPRTLSSWFPSIGLMNVCGDGLTKRHSNRISLLDQWTQICLQDTEYIFGKSNPFEFPCRDHPECFGIRMSIKVRHVWFLKTMKLVFTSHMQPLNPIKYTAALSKYEARNHSNDLKHQCPLLARQLLNDRRDVSNLALSMGHIPFDVLKLALAKESFDAMISPSQQGVTFHAAQYDEPVPSASIPREIGSSITRTLSRRMRQQGGNFTYNLICGRKVCKRPRITPSSSSSGS
jgi:hypothetical protein